MFNRAEKLSAEFIMDLKPGSGRGFPITKGVFMKIIDGKNAVLGRLSSIVAKELLKGEDVVILNADKIIVTGNPKNIKAEYLNMRKIGSPQHGPFFPKRPEMIVRRTIRGMIPYKTARGKTAMKRLRIFVDMPEDFKGKNLESLATKPVRSDYISVGDIAKTLGWHGKVKQ